MQISLTKGTLESNDALDGWIITSATAIAEGAQDVELLLGDIIRINGDVYRSGKLIANVA